MRWKWIVAAFVSASVIARAQPDTFGQAPAFEVASVKPRTGGGPGPAPESPDRFNRVNTTVRDLIRDAYGLPNARVIGGPEWIGSARYDIAAKAGFVPSPQEMQLLVRRLLADRFALRGHMESRELPSFLLLRARDDGRAGPRLTPTTADCAAVEAERRKRGEAPPRVPARRGDAPFCATFVSTTAVTSATGTTIVVRYQTSGATLEDFASFLSTLGNPVGRPVLDRTSLPGSFDIDLEFTPPGVRLNGAVADEQGVSLFTAIQEQLGLTLEPARASVDVFVVDSVARPTPD